MRNSPPKNLGNSDSEQKEKGIGEWEVRLAPLLWPNYMHFYVTMQCCYRKGVLQSILDSSMYRWLLGQGKPRHEVWTQHGCLSRHRVIEVLENQKIRM
jgi:hypothetical protein